MKRYIKVIDGQTVIKTRKQIVITSEGLNTYYPTEEMILADGWEEYIPPVVEVKPQKSASQVMQEIVLEQYNARTDIDDAEALERAIVIRSWDSYVGKPLKAGQCVVYGDNVFRVRQDIAEVLEIYPPDIDTASLYEVIVLTASGEIDDPIAYTPPMEIFEGKYYTQNEVKYRCTRDSGTALSHDLFALVGLYVEII